MGEDFFLFYRYDDVKHVDRVQSARFEIANFLDETFGLLTC